MPHLRGHKSLTTLLALTLLVLAPTVLAFTAPPGELLTEEHERLPGAERSPAEADRAHCPDTEPGPEGDDDSPAVAPLLLPPVIATPASQQANGCARWSAPRPAWLIALARAPPTTDPR